MKYISPITYRSPYSTGIKKIFPDNGRREAERRGALQPGARCTPAGRRGHPVLHQGKIKRKTLKFNIFTKGIDIYFIKHWSRVRDK